MHSAFRYLGYSVNLLLLLAGVLGCSKSTPSLPTTHSPPIRSFLQTRTEMLQKYGKPATTDTTGSYSPCERLTFRSDDLTVVADFSGEQCHYIRYQLLHHWTDEQLTVALNRNGGGWKPLASVNAIMPEFLRMVDYASGNGHRAKYMAPANSVEIWSAQFLARAQQIKNEKERKDREMPRF